MVLHVEKTLKTTIHKKLRKFARKIYWAEFCYSQTIFLRLTVNLFHNNLDETITSNEQKVTSNEHKVQPVSHDTEEWCKIWRKRDLLFQKWQEFGELWSEHSKVLKICTLIGPFHANYITFDLKKSQYSELSFMTLKSHAKFEEKLICGLENDIRNLANIHQNTIKIVKSVKIGIFMGFFFLK